MGFSRQEYWSALPCPSAGDHLTQGLNPHLLHWLASSSPLSHHLRQVIKRLCSSFLVNKMNTLSLLHKVAGKCKQLIESMQHMRCPVTLVPFPTSLENLAAHPSPSPTERGAGARELRLYPDLADPSRGHSTEPEEAACLLLLLH